MPIGFQDDNKNQTKCLAEKCVEIEVTTILQ